MNRPLLALVLVAVLAVGCVSEGDAYRAASVSFVVSVSAAAELRASGKLTEAEVAAISSAIREGDAALEAWSERLKRGEGDTASEPIVLSAVERIRALTRRRE